MTHKGTQKTLRQAIKNGLKQADTWENVNPDEIVIEQHVIDYLSQHFTIAFLKSDEDKQLTDLWKRIKHKE